MKCFAVVDILATGRVISDERGVADAHADEALRPEQFKNPKAVFPLKILMKLEKTSPAELVPRDLLDSVEIKDARFQFS